MDMIMNRMAKVAALFFVLFVSVQLTAKVNAGLKAAGYQNFYDALTPYGTWIDYPDYGYVWHPDVSGFRPFATNGYWEYTDSGWFWDSDYDWGWAPFHYGDWFYDDAYGWLWLPGYDWSPARVDWGVADGFYAWAPIAPEGWSRQGYEWNMIDRNHFYDRSLSEILVEENRMKTAAGKISVARSGPAVGEVEHFTGTKIPTLSIHPVADRNVAGRRVGNDLNTYRPEMKKEAHQISFRQATPQNVRPVHENAAWPEGDLDQQRQNIERMPVNRGGFSDSVNGRR